MRTDSSLSRGRESSLESLSSCKDFVHGRVGLIKEEEGFVGVFGWAGDEMGSGVVRSPIG